MPDDSDKKARLASALRANLARRKAQGRARAAQDEESGPEREEGAAPGAAPLPEGRIVPKDGAG